ncbi:MATE family efflux transporter [Halobacteriovorax sp.]|uniref:MATE family efflux transporter n=1 Tax=Halobacteriovorax sp. TaxID=2020862 RepID=UPI0035656B70
MKARLTQGDIGSQLVSLAGPMIFGVFSIIIFNLVDTYYIGKLGHRELAAVAFTFPIPLMVGAVAFGIGIAATSFVSMALGSGRSDEVSRYATDSLSMVVILGVILVIVGELTIEPLFLFMGAPKDLIPLIAEYMRVWYLSIPLIVVPMTGNSVIRAMGNTKFPAMVMAVAGLGNFIFDPIFIFGFGPIPAMGLQGAAVATALSRFFTLIAAVYVLKKKYNVLTSPFIPIKKLLDNWRKITQVAFPAFLNNLVNPIAMLVLTKLVASHGEIVVAGFGVGTRIEALFSIVLIGIAASLSPFVGQNYGAKKYSRIKTALFMANKYSSIWIFICGLLLMFFSKNLVSVFNDNPKVIEVASTYLKIMIFSIIGLALMQNSVASHNSIGKSKTSLLINLLRIFVIHIPLAVMLGSLYSYEGIYWAGFIANILGGLIGTAFLVKLVKSFPEDSPA